MKFYTLHVKAYVRLVLGMHVSALRYPLIFFAHPSGEEDLTTVHMQSKEPLSSRSGVRMMSLVGNHQLLTFCSTWYQFWILWCVLRVWCLAHSFVYSINVANAFVVLHISYLWFFANFELRRLVAANFMMLSLCVLLAETVEFDSISVNTIIVPGVAN